MTASFLTHTQSPGTLSGIPGLLSWELMWMEKQTKTDKETLCLQLVHFQNQCKHLHFQLATRKAMQGAAAASEVASTHSLSDQAINTDYSVPSWCVLVLSWKLSKPIVCHTTRCGNCGLIYLLKSHLPSSSFFRLHESVCTATTGQMTHTSLFFLQ